MHTPKENPREASSKLGAAKQASRAVAKACRACPQRASVLVHSQASSLGFRVLGLSRSQPEPVLGFLRWVSAGEGV